MYINLIYFNRPLLTVGFRQVHKYMETREKIEVYRISGDGNKELIDDHEMSPSESIGAALFKMSLEQRTPTDAAVFMLNMRDVKGNERRRLKAVVDREALKEAKRLMRDKK